MSASERYARSSTLADSEFRDDISLKRLSGSTNSSNTDLSQLLLSEHEHDEHFPGLPPQDVGRGAWSFLLGIWLLEATLWGFPLAFGVFQSYYSSLPEFKNDKNIPTIGALTISLSYLGVPVTNAIALRYPHIQRYMIVFGWLGTLLSLILASFATEVWHLILTQGFMYGFMWVIGYGPFLLWIPDWFNKRRGLAFGIFFGASGISGLILPFILESSCHRFGFRNTLRCFVVFTIFFSGPGLFLVRPRTPVGHPEHHTFSSSPKASASEIPKPIPNKYAFLRNPYIYFFALAVFLQGLAFFLPPIFLPSFSTSLGLSHTTGDVLLAINSLAQVTGQMLLGHFSDKMHPHIPTTVATLFSGLAALLLWGPAKTFTPLAVFSGIWGFFAGSYSVLWYRAIGHLTHSHAELYTVYGWCSFERGLSMLLAGPIAAGLLGHEVVREEYGLGMFKNLVIFSVVTLLISTTTGFAFLFEWFVERRKGYVRAAVGEE
ncbi:MFS general substrate transporter [Rhizodiscina lignyota]|uniref:MFS general substrate transporter n=1 Tax=Rhizodiscina lignyota TaxID=1504668 RepID=A0A9P4IV32_9PEZI|nr:MFS general substrate transporter [Rhizodiscina lignyota]